ncbi:FAD-dependent oxidoreductase [Rhodococcus ruber]|uniref:ferredoxin--NADP(+) reductase n=1 Tax=Rhodococcus ruber TaxID=1830 RepID=A0A098BMD8_9NOCA|nr:MULTISPECIES: FAD-dependent oxidoreductase [Rhodococcus]ATQ28730.1 ferredoxin [Rhodococcus ruber]MBP2212693.1 ferredoxin--NADP+ reductase [Rhodococcus ruber]MCD2126544.1 FAD-dependent oxidoreductase [Rhodococcus ruber]MCF8781741.1 FAD-dependent oxidoreductase [Rhodococcus ruber]MCZ1071171.1 FAD-dependent oxidoreductase [Rhodococcus sp. A5(2022)]
MAYVITQTCCNDASCVAVCPVNCIHPTPEEREFAQTEMLHIDPQTCIDCGACADACPVEAIFPEDRLTEAQTRFKDINAEYYTAHPMPENWNPLTPTPAPPRGQETLRVAVVGAGPAACYAAQELLERSNVEVEMFDRLPTPWGLVRSGVAPDHPGTKAVTESFEWSFRREAFALHLDVEVGRDIDHDELLAHHHAVVYATGASADRSLGIPGEDLPGSHAATEFVAWYNGHPDYADRVFDLSGERAVLVGNGNVALDVARILTMDVDELARTDIADHALEALRRSNIREVVLLGRRGPAQAAYSNPEFLALGDLNGVDVVVDESELDLDPASAELAAADPAVAMRMRLAREYARREPRPGNKRIVFRYLVSPTAIEGTDRVTGLRAVRNELIPGDDGALVARPTEQTLHLDAQLVLRSIGYRGVPLPGVPFDERRAIVPNEDGRVTGAGPGVYVAGWIKRGPSGVIGTNKACAKETVAALLADFDAGRLARPAYGRRELDRLLGQRRPSRVGLSGWHEIDEAERAAGRAAGRPRVKLTDRARLTKTAAGRPRSGRSLLRLVRR